MLRHILYGFPFLPIPMVAPSVPLLFLEERFLNLLKNTNPPKQVCLLLLRPPKSSFGRLGPGDVIFGTKLSSVGV